MYEKGMAPLQLLLIPQTNILIVLSNDQYNSWPSVYYVVDTETNKVTNVVEMVNPIYYIRYVPAIKSIIGINASTFYVFDIYTMSIIQQAKVVDQGAQADNFIDTAIAVISSYKNIVVAYNIQQQRVANTYYSTSPVLSFSCLTFPENEHLVFMNDNSVIVIWNVDTGVYISVQQVQTMQNSLFAHLQNTYYVFFVAESTQLQLIDYSEYKLGNANSLYTIDTQDTLKQYNMPFDPNQIIVKSLAIKYFLTTAYLRIVNLILFLDNASKQFELVLMSTIYDLDFPSVQSIPMIPILNQNNQEIYISVFQDNVGMPNLYVFIQGLDQTGKQLLLTPYFDAFSPLAYSAQIVLNSNSAEVSYKIISGRILIYDVNQQKYIDFNILNNYRWIDQISDYFVIKNTNSYTFISVNHLDEGKSIMILDLNTQQAAYIYPPDQTILGHAFIYNTQDQKIYAFNQQGTLHIWDFDGNHLSQQQISNTQVIQMLKLKNLIAFVDINYNLNQILDSETTAKFVYQFSNSLSTFKYLEQIDLIFAGETISGKVYGFKLNKNSYLELFIQFKTLISQSIYGIFYTPISKMLYISAQYSNSFFDISQCLLDVQQCLSCSQKFYISNSQQQYRQSNSYGQGLQNYPYTTYQNMISVFLIAQRYSKIMTNIQNIQTQIYTDSQYTLNLEQYILQFNFQNVIQLSFQPIAIGSSSQLSSIKLSGDFQFNNFQSIQIQNITILFDVTQYSNCSLVFNSIISQVVLDNIQMLSSDNNNLDYCNKINLINSQLTMQNILMDSKTFKNQTYVTSIGTQKVKFNNFNLTNCQIGIFSIFNQQSHTILEIKNLNILGNKYLPLQNQNQKQTQSFFSAGQISLDHALIDNNYFLNTNIMQVIAQVNYPNLLFSLSNIILQNNQFQTVSQSVFFSCLFSLLPQPDHQIIASNIFVFNNDIVQNNKLENNQYFFTNLIQSNNINNTSLQNVNLTNNQYLSFIQSQDLFNFQLDTFECSYTNEYLQKYLRNPSSGCISLQETKQIQITNLNISQKLAFDSNLIDILNQKVAQTYIKFYNSSFSNILLFQSQQYKQANPLIIRSSYQNDILIQNCTFYNNTLFGIPNSIAVSSSAIQIMNIVGTATLNQTYFKNLSSNSDINGFYALSQNTVIINSIFDTTLYQQTNQIQSSNQLSQQINLKGGSVNIKSQSVQIIQSVFKTSESHSGGFIYITSYSQTLNVNISQSQFKNGLTKLNGGAIFLDTLGSTTQLFISDSSFENIYQLNFQSSLIYINEDNVGKNAKVNSFIYLNNTNFTNIFGEDITSIFSITLSQLNVNKSFYQVNLTNSQSSILPLDSLNQIYPSTYISSIRSDVYMDKVTIQNIQDKYQISQDHQIFFAVSKSNFKLYNCVIKDIQMNIGGLAFFDQGSIDIQNLQISNIKYQTKNERLLQPLNSYLYQITSLQFSNSIITMNQSNLSNIFCQNVCIGGFALIKSSQLIISNSNFTNIQSYSGGAITIQNPKLNVLISKCNFQDNLSNFDGGALQIASTQIMANNISINKNIFQKNTAQQGQGGAIYFYTQNSTSDNSLTIQDNLINNNVAYIGGGIKYEGIVPVLINNTIQDNKAVLYGQNTFSYPTKLQLENAQEIINSYNNIEVYENKIVINHQRSGESLPNMTFTLRNDYGDIMKFVDTADYQQQNYISIQIDPQSSFFSQYYIRGDPQAGYNSQENSFQFKNIDLIGKPLTKVKLMIKSNLIRDSNTTQLSNNYFFEVEAHIQDCQIGQIPYQYNNFQECTICEKGTYSFDKTQCYKCPNGAECLGGSQIIVDKGYWRSGEYDEDIILCEHLQENCVGGSYGNNICYRGHIGGLCEECDIYGEVWGESYAKSGKYQCSECSKIANNQYIVTVVTLWTLISMVIAIKDNTEEQEQLHQKEIFERIRKRNTISKRPQNKQINSTNPQDQTSVYIKIFTNYFQIISSIATFNLQVPSGIIEFPQSVGQPIQKTINSLDCALKEFTTSMPIIYLRLVFSIIMPIVYLLIFMIGLLIYYKVINKQKNFPYYMINTALIFLLIYTQPDLVAQMIALLSCRQIGNEKYILSNVSFKCYTQDFYQWGLGFILPLLFAFVFLFPYILLRQLKNSKNNLQELKVKRKYSILYKEYTQKCYYWEFVKMAQKLSIILSLNFYSQDIKTKGILVFITITFYSISLMVFNPYKSLQINKLDHYSTNVCAISVLLGIFLYSNSYQYFVIISFTVIIVINALFILLMIRNIILGYTQKFEKPLQDILHKLSSKIKFISNYLQRKKEKDEQQAAKRILIKQKVQKILLIFKSMNIQQKRQLAIDAFTQMIDKKLTKQELQQLNLNNQNSEKQISIMNDEQAKKESMTVFSSRNIIIKFQQSEKSLLSTQKDKQNEEDYQHDIEEKTLKDTQIELDFKKFQK
ncbi:transmembrane protein, putative (macronuclear) [Tetrahymena thermophila SB210]|uniref:Transmembrane protein, putative n=1 Tax=Tetrahymena thermophila (strain SB210) TaxID=312017 RepID=W7XGB2_TETTS|nr:transmembrane protein, putative [Tetrahymena thermophila SB210]EWS73141.1 transmembrane protein, putative [Tetrahymena thermophila SB210]|eukprot:XP_012654328.1 transmembrane protein, putative [Tetrahymena thermophila SB210]